MATDDSLSNQKNQPAFKHILVAVDLSNITLSVLHKANELSFCFGARLYVMSVLGNSDSAVSESQKQQARKKLQDLANTLKYQKMIR